jgi:hypothetical protein
VPLDHSAYRSRSHDDRRAHQKDLSVADILIPDVPEDVIAAIDMKAQRLGLSRADYLRRILARERTGQAVQVAVALLASFAETFADLDDSEVIHRAWR